MDTPKEPMSRFVVPISAMTCSMAGANIDEAKGLQGARSVEVKGREGR
jgi:hypothetical protein